MKLKHLSSPFFFDDYSIAVATSDLKDAWFGLESLANAVDAPWSERLQLDLEPHWLCLLDGKLFVREIGAYKFVFLHKNERTSSLAEMLVDISRYVLLAEDV